MCNNDGVFPYPVIACAGDFQTKLDEDQYYTYVVSTDPAPADTTWLPWGRTNLPVTLILRSISFDPKYETIAFSIGPSPGQLNPNRPGELNVAMCDGSVRSLPASTPPQTLNLMFIRDDGIPIQIPQ